MARARCLMVQGTMSGVGKSLLCAALCRIFRQDGLRTAPFKSQNMALNSYVTKDGGEIGRAQAVQAEAAGIVPDVRMNPILLKPSSDTGSQVIVNGTVRGQMSAAEYFSYKRALIPELLRAYESLAGEYELIVIEGAGSPAEINLRAHDIVNMGLAELVDAPVLLVGDIDRGGVFAQLYGTLALLSAAERARVRGLVINKFRGDLELLRPGLRDLEALTQCPVLGTVPYLPVELEEEDSLAPSLLRTRTRRPIDIAVIRLPRLSNFTDFAPLEADEVLGLRYVHRLRELGRPELLILPGTKSTVADLLWLRESGLEAAVLRLVSEGVPLLGICGGYQMLGECVEDPEGVEGAPCKVRGLGLLPCVTVMAREKQLTRRRGRVSGGALEGAALEGYEIHTGRTTARGESFCVLEDGTAEGCRAGEVQGTYLHGLFESRALVDRLRRWLCSRAGLSCGETETEDWGARKERQYDLLAAQVRKALDMDAVRSMLY